VVKVRKTDSRPNGFINFNGSTGNYVEGLKCGRGGDLNIFYQNAAN